MVGDTHTVSDLEATELLTLKDGPYKCWVMDRDLGVDTPLVPVPEPEPISEPAPQQEPTPVKKGRRSAE